MSQLENKMDDFVPFGGQARTEYQEDDRTVPDAVIDACFDALGEIMFPIDEQGERPADCQTYLAVQRTFGAEGKQDYFLLSHVDQIDAETPVSRDGADWGECNGELACKVYSEPPTLLTFRELSPAALDSLRDEDGFICDVTSEQVEKVFNDSLCTTPSMLTLLEVELNDAHGFCERFADDIAERPQAKEHARTQGPDIVVNIDSYNDDDFITGTVTVDGESCYFYCPNNTRNQNDYDSVILEPLRPEGFEGDIEDVDLPAVIEENRDIVELVVSAEVAPYMDPDKLPGCEQSLDSLCNEKTDEAQSMRYGMEGVGLPMLDAAEHLANY